MLAWVLLFFPMVVAKQSTGLEARSGARSGAGVARRGCMAGRRHRSDPD